jgi:predicted dehydrogenase
LTNRIRVAVVGVGALGEHHARVYASMPAVELVAVIDSRAERAREIAAHHGVRHFTDYREILGAVDAVSVATPTTLHAAIVEDYLHSGAHVLVEKPMSSTLEGADRIISAATKSGRILQVGHVERFNPAVVALREIVKHPRFFEAHRLGLFAPRSIDIDVILDLMIHDLDIISLLVASPVAEIRAVGIPILTGRIDIANARIQFEDGCVANVTASRVSMEKVRKLRLFQPSGYVSVDYTRQDVSIFSLGGRPAGGMPEINSRKIAPDRKAPLEEELKSFLGAVRGENPVMCTGEEGRRALALALQIFEQADRARAREFDRS